MATEFLASGSPRVVSRAIEEYAHAQGHVSVIVVPWEGTAASLSMSVTSVKADGWAIEHTNLGTIVLTDQGDGTTAVALAGHEPDHQDKDRLTALFEHFARQLKDRFGTGT